MNFKILFICIALLLTTACGDGAVGTKKQVRLDKNARSKQCKANCKAEPRFFQDLLLSYQYDKKAKVVKFKYLMSALQKVENENLYFMFRVYLVPGSLSKKRSCPKNKSCAKAFDQYFIEYNSFSLGNNDEKVNLVSKIIHSGSWSYLSESILLDPVGFLLLNEYTKGKTDSTLKFNASVKEDGLTFSEMAVKINETDYIHSKILENLEL